MALITNAKIFDGQSFSGFRSLRIEDGRIQAFLREKESANEGEEIFDAKGGILAPGLIDTHIHGLGGYDCMRHGGIAAMAKLLPRYGVTMFCPTSVSEAYETTRAFLEETLAAQSFNRGSRVLGAHLEGPCLAAKARGAHREDALRMPNSSEFQALLQDFAPVIRRVTIAPELPEALKCIAWMKSIGIAVSVGHSNASAAIGRLAVDAGASLVTHMFNAMPRLHHRDPGITGEVLVNDAIRCEFIADMMHVDPVLLEILLRCKGDDHCLYCTDAMEAAGMPDGRYLLGNVDVDVRHGKATIGETLAGSTLTMDRGLRNLVEQLGLSVERALALGSTNPANIMGLGNAYGRVLPGYHADLVLLDESLAVQATWVRGVCEYQA